ncbi:hypothetical protein BJ085DRAFT_33612 [Dimargaris cristalligena]|uniref:F-box domain-containing protein n=1 Tax=Dimargaris cristalligena TaxID=215637 RepID=A0A4P9ZSL3_9FUNG|nr:hypothetical protein BJ085DRAFT_33612 [Dimargaris cristalligena]|eukprot:RKP36395.1 hypothetical protein BJ085DRAFT_33612 [Dimargaris cristalligena]
MYSKNGLVGCYNHEPWWSSILGDLADWSLLAARCFTHLARFPRRISLTILGPSGWSSLGSDTSLVNEDYSEAAFLAVKYPRITHFEIHTAAEWPSPLYHYSGPIFQHLVSLTLHPGHHITNIAFSLGALVTTDFPNLRHVEHRPSWIVDLQAPAIRTAYLHFLGRAWPHIRSLDLTLCQWTDEMGTLIARNFPRLQSMVVDGNIGESSICSIRRPSEPFKTPLGIPRLLHFGYYDEYVNWDSVMAILARFPNVRELDTQIYPLAMQNRFQTEYPDIRIVEYRDPITTRL